MAPFDVKSRPEIGRLIDELRQALGAKLTSVMLYGSAARGDFEPGTSDVNILVVVEDHDPGTLEALGGPFRRWARRGHPPPPIFSPGQIRDAADVFPVELLDLREHSVVLHGRNAFEGVEVDRPHLRLQVERELREKMMRLREGYVQAHAESAALRRLLTDSYTSFLALFRGCLRLLGETPPVHNAEVAEAFCRSAGLDPQPFREVDRLKRGASPAPDLRRLFSEYHAALSRAAAVVDRLGTAEQGGAS
jgi:hypothetical protein